MNSRTVTSGARPIHVLSLAPFYPSADDDANGCFIAEAIPWLEQDNVSNTVFAVQPLYRQRRHGNGTARQGKWFSYFAVPGNSGLSTSGMFAYARILPAVRALHRTRTIDLIHAHAPLPCGHAAALLSRELGIPFVVSVHGLDAFSSAWAKGYAGSWNCRISQMVYRFAQRVICVSQHVRDEILAKMAGGCEASVVYNGVDPDLFAPPADSSNADVTILSTGNLIATKGHELLLRAVAALKGTFADLSCTIVGDGPELSVLRKTAERLQIADRVHFGGRQSRSSVADSMRRSTIFCLPSHYEGLGCVYLEAMSAGKAAIGCRGQGIEEIIQHNVNGCLINPGDLDGLATTLGILLKDEALRAQIGNAGRRTILAGFTLRHQAQQLGQIYRECLA